MNRWKILAVVIFLSGIFALETTLADVSTRQKVIKLAKSAGLSKKLYAPVKISVEQQGIISIVDEGNFLMQYMIMEPNISAEPNLVIDPNIKIPLPCNNVVIVTHGWIDKATRDWPADIAKEIRKKVDPNDWACGYFDWQGGATVPNPIDAIKYAQNIAGPRLAKALLKLGEFKHIHLIGHSAGCWTIDKAAEIIAEEMEVQIHLTFFDAYVPPRWKESDLGDIKNQKNRWIDHYYTKDITLGATHKNLTEAHNVDITNIYLGVKGHEFPYRWYYATVAGKFRDKDWEVNDKVITKHEGLDYGFARSLEAGQANWEESLTLKKGNEAVKLKKPKKKNLSDLKIFNRKQKDE
ncbi:MAG: hypothetical protein KAS75_02040 [Planctomycetes bacterium]|nr:hypothetical protein [Planctomycetota bacterium]